MKNKKIWQRYIVFFSLIVSLMLSPFSSVRVLANSEPIMIGEEGEYGLIYGDEYDPEQGDTSKWLTIKPGDLGVRIVGDNNQDILRVDKFGGVYINGELYVNNEKYTSVHSGVFTPNNGFMYFLIVVNLGINGYLLFKRR